MKRLSSFQVPLALAVGGLLAACGDGADADLISRAEFVDTYVDLRVAALGGEGDTITDSARAVVLERHGVSEEDLLDFASAHGGDLVFMRGVWNDVEARLDSVPMVRSDTLP